MSAQILNTVASIWAAMRNTADGCHKAFRLKPVSNLEACEDKKHESQPMGGLMAFLNKTIRVSKDQDCFTEILVDAECLASGLASSGATKDIKVVCPIEENFLFTDGTTIVTSTVLYVDYVAAGEVESVSVNGIQVNEDTDPRNVTVSDVGGFVTYTFNNGLGAENDPCDVKIITHAATICTVLVPGVAPKKTEDETK